MSIKDLLLELIDPGYTSRKRDALRLLQALPRRNQWYAIRGANGFTGAHYSCLCGQEYAMVNIADLFKSHRCHCGQRFSLLPADAKASDVHRVLARLPEMPSPAYRQQERSPYQDTWAVTSDGIEYEMADPTKR